MPKWFDPTYHASVPGRGPDTRVRLASNKPLEEYLEARAAGIETVPVLVGPFSYLLLGKNDEELGAAHDWDRLSLLPALVEVYAQVIGALRDAGAQWVQLDEPVLVPDRTAAARKAFPAAYARLAAAAGAPTLPVPPYFRAPAAS